MSELVDTNELYRAPKADLTRESDEGYDQTRALSPKGRFGRIQYLGYSMVISFATGILMALFSAVLAATGVKEEAGVIISLVVLYAALIPISVIFVIRRLHDLNRSGWFTLAFFIPFVNFIIALMLLFMPGTKGANNYGPPPRPPSRLAGFGVIVFFLVFILGILAAIAIPAYQEYAKAAQATQASHQVEAPPPAN